MAPELIRKRLLVVDDDEELGRTLGRMLTRAGYDVTLAASGTAALELMKAGGGYALVLTDVRMPDMSGPAFVMRLRQVVLRGQPAVVFMSGASDEWLDSLRSLGGRFIKKPFLRAELLAMVESALPSARGSCA